MTEIEWDWSRVVFDHVHLRVRDVAASKAFYEAVLRPLGIPLLVEAEWGIQFANLVLSADGPPSERVHVAFVADTRAQVDDFHRAGIYAGYRDNGAPGHRDRYGASYYAAYVLDPDGHNIEALFRE